MCVQLLERSFNFALISRKKGLTKVMVENTVLNSIDLHLHTYKHCLLVAITTLEGGS